MEVLTVSGLALLEITFILVGLLLLHGARKSIGETSFYISIGLLFVFTQLVRAAELKVNVGYTGMDFYIGSTVLFLPYLTLLMVIYITQGTLATQRLIIGTMAALGLFIYLSNVTSLQCHWSGYSLSQGPVADSLDYLLIRSQKTMVATILAQSLDLLLIPVLFQRLRNLKCRMFIALFGALFLTQLIDTFVFTTITFWGEPSWWMHLSSSYIANAFATLWLSIIATIYIARINDDSVGEHKRKTLDIVLAFLGSYGKAQLLEKHIQEWEGRYQLVVEHASDMIFMLNQHGVIIDVNAATLRILRINDRKHIIGHSFSTLLYDMDGTSVMWDTFQKAFEQNKSGKYLTYYTKTTKDKKVLLNMAYNVVEHEKAPVIIIFARDITKEHQFEEEKMMFQQQREHSQRIESIGRLAGGVAHDFNNYLHAIQGHLDILKYMYEVDEDIEEHLNKIDHITEQATVLTQQLLGFARKGKYNSKQFDLRTLIKETVDLFGSSTLEGLIFEHYIHPIPMMIKGEAVQLQQVVLNLLINARDALESRPKGQQKMELRVQPASTLLTPLRPPKDVAIRERSFYYVISLSDNGEGISEENLPQIFEPFFTTKPLGKGTGMGLAMAYGTAINHGGWLQVETELDVGTTFYLFLPKLEEDA